MRQSTKIQARHYFQQTGGTESKISEISEFESHISAPVYLEIRLRTRKKTR